MTYETTYRTSAPTRDEVDAMAGAVVLEFGTEWCGHCQAAAPVVAAAIGADPALVHVRVEDGRGRPLGRSFQVKVWPTLVMLRDGREVGRVVRPTRSSELQGALEALRQP